MDSFKPDWDSLPGWVSVIAVLLLLTKDYLKTGFDNLFSSRSDTREHRQMIEESKIDYELQDRATERARQREIDNQALGILSEALDWSRREFSTMDEKIDKMAQQQGQQLFATNRTNDLLTLHNTAIAELVDETKALTREVRQLVSQLKNGNEPDEQ